MAVEIIGKKNCGLCEAAKDKMARLGVPYAFFDVEELAAVHDGWREDGSVERQALLALNNSVIPTIVIDGAPFIYSAAMAQLKKAK